MSPDEVESFLNSFTHAVDKRVAEKMLQEYYPKIELDTIKNAIVKGAEEIDADEIDSMRETMLITNAQGVLSSIESTVDFDFLVVGFMIQERETYDLDVTGCIVRQDGDKTKYFPSMLRLSFTDQTELMKKARKIEKLNIYNIFVTVSDKFDFKFEQMSTLDSPLRLYGKDVTDFDRVVKTMNGDLSSVVKDLYGIDMKFTVEKWKEANIHSGLSKRDNFTTKAGKVIDYYVKSDLKLLLVHVNELPSPTRTGYSAIINGTTYLNNEKIGAFVPNTTQFNSFDPQNYDLLILTSVKPNNNSEYDNYTLNAIAIMPVLRKTVRASLKKLGA